MKKNELMEIILERGTENIIPDKKQLKKLLGSKKKLNIYLGIDPTATHIHLGHAVPLRKLQAFAELGHNVFFLIGDFTALVGDTSDKNSERPILTIEDIERNFQTYKDQASKILDFSKVKVVHNREWLHTLTFGDVLSLTRHFSLNNFIGRELIQKRLSAGKRVGLAETLYPLMQGYDSYHLDTDLQIGGTDQTFNMQAGRALIKDIRKKESFVLANGFLLGTDGRKMSKSWGNAIWLDDMPNDMYGKVMSLKDDLIPDYFTLATSLPKKTIDTLLADYKDEPMELKKQLAERIVTELYDEEAASQAANHFFRTIQQKSAPSKVKKVMLPAKKIELTEFLSLLVEHGLIASKSEGKRLFKQQAIYLNNNAITTEVISFQKKENSIRIGKRRYLNVVIHEK